MGVKRHGLSKSTQSMVSGGVHVRFTSTQSKVRCVRGVATGDRIYPYSGMARGSSHHLIHSYIYTCSILLIDMRRSPASYLIYMDLSSTRARVRRVHRPPFCYSRPTVYRATCGELLTRTVPVAKSPGELREHPARADSSIWHPG